MKCGRGWLRVSVCAAVLGGVGVSGVWAAGQATATQPHSTGRGSTGQGSTGQGSTGRAAVPDGTPFSPEMLAGMLPATVYFQGRTAPLQLRNAGGAELAAKDGAGHAAMWVALVDSSGYASDVQERYQFYLVSEGPLEIGGHVLPAGAYGGGFLGDRFLLMDLGGHTVAEGATETDAAMKRPRPLQVVAETPSAVRLYLGRRWVGLQAGEGRAGR